MALPTFIDVLQKVKIVKVRAGAFSAALSADSKLFVWGQKGFDAPRELLGVSNIKDLQISRAGFAALITF